MADEMIYAAHAAYDAMIVKARHRKASRSAISDLSDALDAFEIMQEGDKNPLLPQILRERIKTAMQILERSL